ncbi:MAG TPA: methyl-accepting chemotaxis protein [Burkholderiaceae bacterium]|jgi:methyl-accepting chemotaxis protein
MKFSNLTLVQRFLGLLVIVVLGFVAFGACSFKVLGDLKVNGPVYQRIVQGKDLIADILPPPEYIIESYLVTLQMIDAAPTERKALIDNLKVLKSDYDTRHIYWANEHLDTVLSEQLLQKADQPAQEFYKIAFDQFLPALEKDDKAAVTSALTIMKARYAEHRNEINKLVGLANKRNESDESGAKTQITSSTWLMAGILFASVSLAALFLMRIAGKLVRQLGGEPAYAAAITARIAAGDLTGEIDTHKSTEDSLLMAMKNMRDSLARIVTEVRIGTENIATASGQISSGNMELSSRTEGQASALEQTAASMEELTSTVKQNAENSYEANLMAKSASQIAIKGGSVVAQVVETMGSINESSKKIVDIIGVIDGIAFQTNILALNAAVEAARAGEQGRGFAVVASEVRNLAQRSAAAAKEIKTLIGNSVEKIDVGAQLVDEAGKTMDEVVASVRRVTDIIGDITNASNEQTSGIAQINQAIMHMDSATQQNSAMVEEAASAARSLHEQADSLSRLVRVFKLTENGAGSTTIERQGNSVATISSTERTTSRNQRMLLQKAVEKRERPILGVSV